MDFDRGWGRAAGRGALVAMLLATTCWTMGRSPIWSPIWTPARAQADACAEAPDCAALVTPRCLARFEKALTRQGAGAAPLTAPADPAEDCGAEIGAYRECLARRAACAPPRVAGEAQGGSRNGGGGIGSWSWGELLSAIGGVVSVGGLAWLALQRRRDAAARREEAERREARLRRIEEMLQQLLERARSAEASPEELARFETAARRAAAMADDDPALLESLTLLAAGDVAGFKESFGGPGAAKRRARAETSEATTEAAAAPRRELAEERKTLAALAAPFDRTAAREAYGEAVELDPEDADAAVQLAALLAEEGALEKAAPLARRVAETQSAAPAERLKALIVEGDIARARGDAAAARTRYGEAQAVVEAAKGTFAAGADPLIRDLETRIGASGEGGG